MNTLLRIFIPLFFLINYWTSFTQENIPKLKNLNFESPDAIALYKKKADSLAASRKFEQSLILYDQLYAYVKTQNNDSIALAVTHDYLNLLIRKKRDTIKSNEPLIYFNNLCKSIKDTNCRIKSLTLEGDLLREKKKYYEALKFYNNAVDLLTPQTPNVLKGLVYHKRGYLFESLNQLKKARKDYKNVLRYVLKMNDSIRIAVTYSNISSTFPATALDSTMKYTSMAYNFCKSNNNSSFACTLCHNNFASILVNKGQPEKAKEIFKKINLAEVKADPQYNIMYGTFTHTLGSIYMALGEYDKAINEFETSKKHSIKRKHLGDALTALEDLSKAYEKNGDIKSSLETTRMIKPLMDTLDLQKIQREVAKLESQRKLKEKEEELIALKKEKETVTLRMSKAQFTSYLLGILLIIGTFIFINRISVNKVKFHKLNEKVNHNRLLSLQSAMNPHFLFNTFGTLQHFILKKEVKKANSYMTTLSELIRNVFASSNSIYIHFNNEINILKSYIELELGRFDHSFEVTFEIPQQLTKDNPLIPSMILQPYLENAIIHGFSEKKANKKLTIKFYRIDTKTMQCQVIDNGVGRKKVGEIQRKSKVKKNLSIATKNTQERLKIINKKDEQEGNIIIQDLYDIEGKSNGTKVIVSLPIINNKNS